MVVSLERHYTCCIPERHSTVHQTYHSLVSTTAVSLLQVPMVEVLDTNNLSEFCARHTCVQLGSLEWRLFRWQTQLADSLASSNESTQHYTTAVADCSSRYGSDSWMWLSVRHITHEGSVDHCCVFRQDIPSRSYPGAARRKSLKKGAQSAVPNQTTSAPLSLSSTLYDIKASDCTVLEMTVEMEGPVLTF